MPFLGILSIAIFSSILVGGLWEESEQVSNGDSIPLGDEEHSSSHMGIKGEQSQDESLNHSAANALTPTGANPYPSNRPQSMTEVSNGDPSSFALGEPLTWIRSAYGFAKKWLGNLTSGIGTGDSANVEKNLTGVNGGWSCEAWQNTTAFKWGDADAATDSRSDLTAKSEKRGIDI